MLLSLLVITVLGLPAQPATIQGMVRAEGSREPIPGAAISIAELNRRVYADAHGFFVMPAVPAGRWRVEAAALGYSSHAITVVANADGAVRLDFELALRPVQLPGVEVRSSTEQAATSDFVPPADPGPASIRMNAQAMKIVPGLAEPDVFRALQTLPSVSAISDYSSALYVRGGSADQNLITLDGMPLFNPYHIGGIFSAIPTDAVSTADVASGALTARVGDRLASAVTINTREGSKDRIRTSGGIGLISTNLTIDGPLNAGRGSFLASGRRTYLNALTDVGYGLGLLDFTMPYGFSDAYAKLTHRVGELGAVSLSAYWNRESVDTPERMRDEFSAFGTFDWGSRMLSLMYRQPLSQSMLLQARAGYSDFIGEFDGFNISESGSIRCNERGECDYSDWQVDTFRLVLGHTKVRDLTTGADLTWFGRVHIMRAGVQLDAYVFDHALEALDDADPDYFPNFRERAAPTTFAAYIEDEWQPGPRVRVRGGIRALTARGYGTAVMPRVGVRWQITDAFAVNAGAGRYAQMLRTMKDDESVVSSLIAYDILTAQPAREGFATGSDVVAGIDYVRPRTRVRVEAFRKSMNGLVLAAEPDEPMKTPPLITGGYRVGSGRARGLELSARHAAGRFDIGASYALSSAERTVGDEAFAPRYDRLHQLDMSGEYRWGERGIVSARLVAASGQPFTPAHGVTPAMEFDPVQQRWHSYDSRLVLGEHNSDRLPGYMRLDIAARRSSQRRWFGREGTITPYVQVLNVLNNRNALVAEPQPSGRPRFGYWPQLPILPTFGVEWRF